MHISKKNALLLILFIGGFLFSSCHTSSRTTGEQDQLNIYQKSFLTLAGELKKNHPGLPDSPLQAMTEEEFERSTNDTCLRLKNVDNKRDFFFIVSQYIAHFNDGHSGIFYGPIEKKILPVSLTWIDDELFISRSFDPRFTELVGSKVVQIAGRDTADFEKTINAFRQTDRHNLFHLRKEQFGSNFFMMLYDTYSFLGLTDKESVPFTLQQKGSLKNLSLPFTGMEGITDDNLFPLARNNITECTFRNHFSVIDNLSTLYFQLGADELTSGMIKEVFRTIKEKGLGNLVIDLRNSGGGEPGEAAVEFFNYLVPGTGYYSGLRGWSRDGARNREITENRGKILIEAVQEDLRFSGKLFLFTNGTTFSSSAVFAMMAVDNGFAEVWGEPCGSNIFRYGKKTMLPLPDIETGAFFSSMIWNSGNAENTSLFIMPDVPVYQTIEHYINGEDALWDYYKNRNL